MRFRIMMLAAAVTVTAVAAYQKNATPVSEKKLAVVECCSGDPLPVCPPICSGDNGTNKKK
jgi:hypothetical protein